MIQGSLKHALVNVDGSCCLLLFGRLPRLILIDHILIVELEQTLESLTLSRGRVLLWLDVKATSARCQVQPVHCLHEEADAARGTDSRNSIRPDRIRIFEEREKSVDVIWLERRRPKTSHTRVKYQLGQLIDEDGRVLA